MSLTVAELNARLTADTSDFQKAMGKAEKEASGAFDKIGKAGDKLRSAGTKLTTFATLPVLGLGVAAFKAAGDVGESLNKVNEVFGASAKEIDAWAKSSAKSVGLSRNEALDAAGAFGNMFTQLGIGVQESAKMSTSIVGLAADFASFHNADITDVVQAQSAAFRGEYDSLQRFLPLINAATVEQKALEMTGKASNKELTAQEKALAVNALMFEGAGKAAGDFARTSDSAANAQRITTAQIKDAAAVMGEQLIPIAQKVIGVVSGLASWFGNLSSSQQNTILIVGGLVAALGPAIAIIGNVIAVVRALSVAMAFLAANPVVLIIAGIAALTAGLVVAYQKSETFRNLVNQAFEGLKVSVETMWRVVRPILDALLDVLRRVGDVVGKVAGPLGAIAGTAGKIVGGVGGAIGGILPKFHDGGVVPGPRGADVPIMAQAGERVIPAGSSGGGGGGGQPIVVQLVADGRIIQEILLGHQRRNGALGFREN